MNSLGFIETTNIARETYSTVVESRFVVKLQVAGFDMTAIVDKGITYGYSTWCVPLLPGS